MEVLTLNSKDCRKWKFADREEVQGINSKILVWARETAGMSLEEASKKLSKNIDHLVELENGNRNPTRNILSKMSAKYRRPLLTFYLEEPPQKGKPRSHCILQDNLRPIHSVRARSWPGNNPPCLKRSASRPTPQQLHRELVQSCKE